MKFSFEVPIPHLMDFYKEQDFIFTLNHLFKDKDYCSFIEKVQYEKDIWLDNSYNELMKACSVLDLADTYRRYNFKKVISPDAPNFTTSEIMAGVSAMVFQKVPFNKLLIVASSSMMKRELEDRYLIKSDQIAVSYWIRPKLNKLDLIDFEGTHFLGLLNIEELQIYKPASCDTSMPIKLAILGQDINRWMQEGYRHIHTKDLGTEGMDFFNMKMTPWQIDLAIKNIRTLKKLAKKEAKDER